MFYQFNRPTPGYPPQRVLQPEARASPFSSGLTDY